MLTVYGQKKGSGKSGSRSFFNYRSGKQEFLKVRVDFDSKANPKLHKRVQ